MSNPKGKDLLASYVRGHVGLMAVNHGITKFHTPSCLGREEAIRRKGQAGDLAHGGLYLQGQRTELFESLSIQ